MGQWSFAHVPAAITETEFTGLETFRGPQCEMCFAKHLQIFPRFIISQSEASCNHQCHFSSWHTEVKWRCQLAFCSLRVRRRHCQTRGKGTMYLETWARLISSYSNQTLQQKDFFVWLLLTVIFSKLVF